MPSGGDCGVGFFMMLSGFVLCAGYEQRFTAGSIGYAPFLKRRIAKVYPLHLLCFIWAVSLFDYEFDVSTLSKAALNLSLLQSWTLTREYYFSFNAVSWFLSDVVFFYALFPVICRNRLIYRTNFIAIFATLCLIYICVIPQISESAINSVAYIFPASRLLDFIIGMLLWRLYSCCRDKKIILRFSNLSTWKKSICEFAAFALLAVSIALYRHVPEAYRVAVYWWPCMAVIIITFSFADKNGGLFSRLLSTGALQMFGEMAFSFYMVHLLGINTFTRVVFKLGIGGYEWLCFVIITIAIVIFAYFTHRVLKR